MSLWKGTLSTNTIKVNCIIRDKKRHWKGVNCGRRRSFLCESNLIYTEVDIKNYKVNVDIKNGGIASVNLQVNFDSIEQGDTKDVPLTLVVPRNAGIQ